MSDRVWHFNSNGVFSGPKVHANGHVRPKSVTFGTKEAAIRAWLKATHEEIDHATRMLREARTESRRHGWLVRRADLRKREKCILKDLKAEQEAK